MKTNTDMNSVQPGTDQLKFNPQVHVGTRFDPNRGRRVAVSDPNLLPKVNTGVTNLSQANPN